MTLSESLHTVIEEWLNRSKHNNLKTLADKLRIPYATLHRIYQGQVDKPQIDSVLVIIEGILPREERGLFLKEHYPHIAGAFANPHFENKPGTANQYERPDLDDLFVHREGFLLGQHLLSCCGITEEKILDLYGSHGLEIIKALEKTGTVQYIDGRWQAKVSNYVSSSVESNIQQVQHAASSFNVASGEVGAAYIRNLSEGVTIEAARQIRRELDAVAMKIDDIAQKNPGQHVFVSTLMTHLLDPAAAIKEIGETK